ncbi:MAG: PPOX class F420-dependent oxidoreductase [Actinomycetota bacterium]
MNMATLAKEPFVSVTTFKRDGTPVSTPVWCAAEDGTLLVFSEADSWKVKRIRRDRHVRIGPCSARGRPRGPAVDADASIVEGTEPVQTLLATKYGWAWHGYRLLMVLTDVARRLRRQEPTKWVTIKITLRALEPRAERGRVA